MSDEITTASYLRHINKRFAINNIPKEKLPVEHDISLYFLEENRYHTKRISVKEGGNNQTVGSIRLSPGYVIVFKLKNSTSGYSFYSGDYRILSISDAEELSEKGHKFFTYEMAKMMLEHFPEKATDGYETWAL